jgi:16S rRNA (adenine1518-N6/adenine1519-N6)-dimethyltransferase
MPGQTLSDIRELLSTAGLAPRHRYGQNFLVDLNLMRKLVAAAELKPTDVVLEVGPGTGSLTELLLESGARVVACEIDHGLQNMLRSKFGELEPERFTLVAGDALAGKHAINPDVLAALREKAPAAGGVYKLVANLPYQIATPLLLELLYGAPPFERLVCTIQKEVGERLMAGSKTDAYGPISVVAQTLAQIETIAVLPASAFWPRPKIESVMLKITPTPRCTWPPDTPGFVNFVRSAFQQRRKKLTGALRGVTSDPPALLGHAQVDPNARAEELSPPSWRLLWQAARSPRE